MRRQASIGALLLIAVGVVLGGTVLRGQVASAKSKSTGPFFATFDVGATTTLVGPTSSTIQITSLSASPVFAGGTGDLRIWAVETELTATDCPGPVPLPPHVNVWHIPHITGPFGVSFPTPLVLSPNPEKKLCLMANSFADALTVNASGFLK
jgi:hypothetical protein